MINVNEQPYAIPDFSNSTDKMPPVPLSDCIQFELQPEAADVVVTDGVKATVTITIPATCTVPANGTAFKIWGRSFTVNNATTYTSTSFKVETVGLLTAFNFANMVNANLFFNRSVTMATTSGPGGSYVITITWNECREQSRFTASDFNLTVFTTIGGSGAFANGVSPVYTEGYQVITRAGVWQDATSEFKGLTVFEGMTPDRNCTGSEVVKVAINNSVEQMLYVSMPELSNSSFIGRVQNGRSLMRLFSLEYGWTYRDNCQAQSGTIVRSDRVLCIFASFNDDPYGMRRYWPNHPDGLPPGQTVIEFLTTQPKAHELRMDSYAWLWMCDNWQKEYSGHRLMARFSLYKKGTPGVFEQFTAILETGGSWYQAICFNVSPGYVIANAPTITADNLEAYEVAVFGIEAGNTTVLFNATEYLKYNISPRCSQSETDLYFVTPAGGISTQVVDVDIREIDIDGQEVYINQPCEWGYSQRAASGGRRIANIRAKEQVTITCRLVPNDTTRRWYQHIKTSPSHWLKTKDQAGNPIAKKLIIDPGSVRIKDGSGLIELRLTGYFNDLNTQSGMNF